MNQNEIKELRQSGFEEWLDEVEEAQQERESELRVEYARKLGWVIFDEAAGIVLRYEFSTEKDAASYLAEHHDELVAESLKACETQVGGW